MTSVSKLILSEEQRDFHTKEYDVLRREIEIQISERRKIETETLIAAVAIYAWLLTRPEVFDSDLIVYGFLIPVVLFLLGAIRWGAVMLRVIEIGSYLQVIERAIGHPELGWETKLFKLRQSSSARHKLEGWTGVILWIVLIIASTVMAAVMLF